MSCAHPNSTPTRRTLENGHVIVFLQCQECGGGRAGKTAEFKLWELPEYDPLLRSKFHESQDRERKSEQEAFARERLEKKSQWWSDYNAYLESAHWRFIRGQVLKRDPWCMCCMREPSSQAHHLSYSNYNQHGMSFPVDCIGICKECHDVLHGKGDPNGIPF